MASLVRRLTLANYEDTFLICSRYTFDIIGELFYGRAFGFIDEGKDQNDWIKSLDKMIPFVCLMGVAPPILRPLIGLGTMISSAGKEIRKGV